MWVGESVCLRVCVSPCVAVCACGLCTEIPMCFLALCTRALATGDEDMGDHFGKALLRTLKRQRGVIDELRSVVTSRDLGMLRHAGGSLSRRIEAWATVLVGSMCKALLRRSRRRTAATLLQRWSRFRRMQWYARERFNARKAIRRIAKGSVRAAGCGTACVRAHAYG